MNNVDRQYLTLVQKIIDEGIEKKTRNDEKSLSLFGQSMLFDLRKGFPILTTKEIHFKGIVHELLWMLSGSTNIKYLCDHKVTIWSLWPYNAYCEARKKIIGDGSILFVDEKQEWYPELSLKEFEEKIRTDDGFAAIWGDIGDGGYGKMFRDFNGYDQVSKTLNELKKDPYSRRHVITLWSPDKLKSALLPPCHFTHVFNCEPMTVLERRDYMWRHSDKYDLLSNNINPDVLDDISLDGFDVPKIRLNLLVLLRSNDIMLGAPYNISQYSLLLSLYAHCLDYDIGYLNYSVVDAHIYSNHIEGSQEQLKRTSFDLPSLKLNINKKNLFEFNHNDIELVGYKSHARIKMDVSL